jgi:hypothetical protein
MSFRNSFRRILLPAVRFAVRRALPIQEFIEITKELYVNETCRQMSQTYEPNVSQVAVATGMHRRDVTRLMTQSTSYVVEEPTNLLMKILGTWEQDAKFCDKRGKPRPLRWKGSDSDFHFLVSSLSKDVSPRSIRQELLRLGIVEEQEDTIKLLGQPELLLLGDQEGFAQLASDVQTIGDATFENLYHRQDPPNLHARTEYDNIYIDSIPEIRQWFVDLGTEIHQRARSFLCDFDKDLAPDPKRRAGAKVTFCTFSFTESASSKRP